MPAERSARLQTMLKDTQSGNRTKKRADLRRVLIGKLEEQYGRFTSDPSEASLIIQSEVDRLFKRHKNSKITETHLRILEENVSELTSQLSMPPTERSEYDEQPAGDKAEGVLTKKIPEDSYQVFMEAQAVQYERQLDSQKKATIRSKQEMKRALDRQVLESQRRKQREREENQKYGVLVEQQVKEYHSSEALKKAVALKANLDDKRMRQEQIDEKIERKRMQLMRKQAEEGEEIRRIHAELNKEQKRKEDKVREQQLYMRKVEKDNALQRSARAKQKKREQEEDNARAAAYAKKLDDEEEARRHALQKLKDKSKSSQDMYLKANKTRFANEAAADRRIAELAEAAVREGLRKQEEERKKRLSDKIEMNRVLGEQVALKKKREADEKKFRDAFSKVHRKEAEDALAAERQRAAERRKANHDNRRILEEQMASKSGSVDETDPTKMTQAEARLNAPDYRKICADTELVLEVSKRMEKLSNVNRIKRDKLPRATNKPGMMKVKQDYFRDG